RYAFMGYCPNPRVPTMPLHRRIALAGLLLSFALLAAADPTLGQAPVKGQPGIRKEGYVSGESRARVNEMRDGKLPFTNPKDLPGQREDLKKMAEFLVFRVTHEEFYNPPTATKGGEIRHPATDLTIQSILEDM